MPIYLFSFFFFYLFFYFYNLVVVWGGLNLKPWMSLLEMLKSVNSFFLKNFNLWRLLLMIALYHQTKTPISFWSRQGLSPRSLIQPLKTLPIELIETHQFSYMAWLTKLTSLDEVSDTDKVTLTDKTTTPLTKVKKPFNTVNK